MDDTEHKAQKATEWAKNNPERRKEIARKWRERNPDYGKSWKRQRIKSRRFYSVLSSIKSRCAKTNTLFDLDEEYLESIFPTDGLCPITRRPLLFFTRSSENFSVDRIRPEGGYVRGNVAIISVQANLMKQDCVDPTLFRRLADWLQDTLDVSK